MKDPAWLLPDEPAPVRYMNTIWADTHGVHDELTDAMALRDWLAAVTNCERTDLGRATQDEFTGALRLRDGLRRLAAHCTADGRPAAQSPVTEIDEQVDSQIGVPACLMENCVGEAWSKWKFVGEDSTQKLSEFGIGSPGEMLEQGKVVLPD